MIGRAVFVLLINEINALLSYNYNESIIVLKISLTVVKRLVRVRSFQTKQGTLYEFQLLGNSCSLNVFVFVKQNIRW